MFVYIHMIIENHLPVKGQKFEWRYVTIICVRILILIELHVSRKTLCMSYVSIHTHE